MSSSTAIAATEPVPATTAPGPPAPRRAAPHRVRGLVHRWVPPALLLAALVGVWEVWVVARHTPAYVVPTPGRVGRAFADSASLLPRHVWATTVESVAGLVVGAAAGVVIAALVAGVPLARRTIEPLLVASQTVPMIVLAPMLAFWFGIGTSPKVIVVALVTFFPVAVSTAAGLTDADPELVDLVRGMGGDRRAVMRTVRLPAAIPAFFSGLRIASAYAVGGAVIGELVAGDRGLGVFINRSKASFRVDRIFVAVVVITVLSAGLFGAVGVLARWAAPWRHLSDDPRELS